MRRKGGGEGGQGGRRVIRKARGAGCKARLEECGKEGRGVLCVGQGGRSVRLRREEEGGAG